MHFEVTKGAGESFGHEFLMFKTDAYVAARTLEFSKFACLKRDKFKTVLDAYPEMYPHMRLFTIQQLWMRIFRVLSIQVRPSLHSGRPSVAPPLYWSVPLSFRPLGGSGAGRGSCEASPGCTIPPSTELSIDRFIPHRASFVCSKSMSEA